MFKHFNKKAHFKHKQAKARLALLALALLIVAAGLSCGKRKPPLPPVERVSQRVEAAGFQRGGQIILSWKMPARNAKEGDVQNISRADIYRLAEPLTAPLSLSEEEFASRSVVIASVPISDDDFGFKTMTYPDTLEFASQPVRLRYAVRLVNSEGQRAGFSNFLLIEPTGKVAANPTSLSAEVSQESIALEWKAPTKNADGTTPLNIIGYNVYRSHSEDAPAKLLTEKPVANTEYSDTFFDFDTRYFYFVRAVSVGKEGEPIESGETNIAEVLPKDTFEPQAPRALTVAVSHTSIAIFFAVNPENDIAGYRIYRTDDPNKARSDWSLLTEELLDRNTFQDENITSGTRYYYYVTAVDKRGNVSEPSEVVSETAP